MLDARTRCKWKQRRFKKVYTTLKQSRNMLEIVTKENKEQHIKCCKCCQNYEKKWSRLPCQGWMIQSDSRTSRKDLNKLEIMQNER